MSWHRELFEYLPPAETLDQIARTIRLESQTTRSSCSWNLTSSGDFSTKATYQSWKSLNWPNSSKLWTEPWRAPVTQRIHTFTWLIVKERLLTNSERYRRHKTSDQQCPRCNSCLESIDHVFKLCPLAAEVWSKILPEVMHRKLNGTSVVVWLKDIIVQSRWPTSWRVGIMVTFWKLWACRNSFIFYGTYHKVDGILSQIRSIVLHIAVVTFVHHRYNFC